MLSEACLILLGSGSFYMQICKYKRRQAARLQDSGIPPEQWPRVDVMVPCFKEPLAVIEKTLRAALAIDWPANKLTVLLLDDGGSQGNCPSFMSPFPSLSCCPSSLLPQASPPVTNTTIIHTHQIKPTQRLDTW